MTTKSIIRLFKKDLKSTTSSSLSSNKKRSKNNKSEEVALRKYNLLKEQVSIGLFLKNTFTLLNTDKKSNSKIFHSSSFAKLLNVYSSDFNKAFTEKVKFNNKIFSSSSATSSSNIVKYMNYGIKLPSFTNAFPKYAKKIFDIPILLKIKENKRQKRKRRLSFFPKLKKPKILNGIKRFFKNFKTKAKSFFNFSKLKTKLKDKAGNMFSMTKFMESLKQRIKSLQETFENKILNDNGKTLSEIERKRQSERKSHRQMFLKFFGILVGVIGIVCSGLKKVLKGLGKIIVFPFKLAWKVIKKPFKALKGRILGEFNKDKMKADLKKFSLRAIFISLASNRSFWYAIGWIAGMIVSFIKGIIRKTSKAFSILTSKEFWDLLIHFKISDIIKLFNEEASRKFDNKMDEIEKDLTDESKKESFLNKIKEGISKKWNGLIETIEKFEGTQIIDSLKTLYSAVYGLYEIQKEYNIIDLFKDIFNLLRIGKDTAIGRGAMLGAATIQGPPWIKLIGYFLGMGIAAATGGIVGLFKGKDSEKFTVSRQYSKILGGDLTKFEDGKSAFNKAEEYRTSSEMKKKNPVQIQRNLSQFYGLRTNLIGHEKLIESLNEDDEGDANTLLGFKKSLLEYNKNNKNSSPFTFTSELQRAPFADLFNFDIFTSNPNSTEIKHVLFRKFQTEYSPEKLNKLPKDAIETQYNFLKTFSMVRSQYISLLQGFFNTHPVEDILQFMDNGLINYPHMKIAEELLNGAIDLFNKEKRVPDSNEYILSKVPFLNTIKNELDKFQVDSKFNPFLSRTINAEIKLTPFRDIDKSKTTGILPSILFSTNRGKSLQYDENYYDPLEWKSMRGNPTQYSFNPLDNVIFNAFKYNNGEYANAKIQSPGVRLYSLDEPFTLVSMENPTARKIMTQIVGIFNSGDFPKEYERVIDSKKVNELNKEYIHRISNFRSPEEFVQSIVRDQFKGSSFADIQSQLEDIHPTGRKDVSFLVDTMFKILAAMDEKQ